MKLRQWWMSLPDQRRIPIQVAWCFALVLILVIFWSQKNEFIYAAF